MAQSQQKVFISWSGEQSHAVAIALRNVLPEILAGRVQPFVSSEDIGKGARGLSVIESELKDAVFGIVVVTRENMTSVWINFEAGALSNKLNDGLVAPLLIGLKDPELIGPLKQFQNTDSADRNAMLKLVFDINKSLEDSVRESSVEKLFNSMWDELEAGIHSAPVTDGATEAPREQADVLNEVLTTVRSLERTVGRLSEGRTLPRATRSVDDPFEERVLAILERTGATEFSWTTGGNKLEISIGTDIPRIDSSVSDELLDLSTAFDRKLTVLTPDTRRMVIDPHAAKPVRRFAPSEGDHA